MLFRRSDLDELLVIPVTSRREERRLLYTWSIKKGDFLSQEVVRSDNPMTEVSVICILMLEPPSAYSSPTSILREQAGTFDSDLKCPYGKMFKGWKV